MSSTSIALIVAALVALLVLVTLVRTIRIVPQARAGVVERVDAHGGRVKIGGEIWSARALDGDQVLEPGTNVQVAEIQGATALVYL